MNPRQALAGVLIACVTNATMAFGQIEQPLSLDDCVRLAKDAPSSVTSAARQTSIEHARIAAARAGLLPRVSFFAGYSRNSVDGAAHSFASLNGINQYTALVEVIEEVDLSGRLRSVRRRAEADEDAARINQLVAARDLRRLVAAAYHRVLLARMIVTVATESLGEAQRFAARAALLSTKGEAARADIVKAQAQATSLRQALRSAELEATLANQDLASFWTTDVSTPLALVETLSTPPPPAPSMSRSRRLELSVADARVRGLEAATAGARAARYPQGSVVLQYGVDSTRLAWRDRGYALVLNLNIPIFDWSAARNSALQLSLQGEQARLDRQAAERRYSREYHTALERVRSLYDQIAGAQDLVTLSQENLKLSRLRYDGGEGSALEVVNAQNQWAQARVDQLGILASHAQALVELELAGGQ